MNAKLTALWIAIAIALLISLIAPIVFIISWNASHQVDADTSKPLCRARQMPDKTRWCECWNGRKWTPHPNLFCPKDAHVARSSSLPAAQQPTDISKTTW